MAVVVAVGVVSRAQKLLLLPLLPLATVELFYGLPGVTIDLLLPAVAVEFVVAVVATVAIVAVVVVVVVVVVAAVVAVAVVGCWLLLVLLEWFSGPKNWMVVLLLSLLLLLLLLLWLLLLMLSLLLLVVGCWLLLFKASANAPAKSCLRL